jgi:sterol desaturase/sphingolipid hydroxylase (fatty acid hydroxylase superfamily)
MEAYGKILLIAMPVFLALVLFEKWYGWYKGKDTVRNMDMVSSLSSGITKVIKDVLGLSFVILSYGWLVKHLAIVHIQSNFLVYLIALISLDFSSYWVHRIEHERNLFWNNHIVHHSSEEFNLACALRESISVFIKISMFLLLPAALLGVEEKVIVIVGPFFLFAGFWYHTQHINKLGFLEKIIITPSHHRVHHAINPEYLDKNYGQIFLLWDKIFGTFQEELPHVKPVYGITRPAQTWNPIKINFQHAWLLIKDAWRTKSRRDKLRIWIMPTGWRPADVVAKYPVYKIEDTYHFKKYDPDASSALQVWSWMQIIFSLLFVSYLFGNIAFINKMNGSYVYLYGAFILLNVYSFTELMDRNAYAIFWELLKNIFGIAIIIKNGDWFGIKSVFPILNNAVIGYFILSTIVTAYFVYSFYKENSNCALAITEISLAKNQLKDPQ